MPCAPYRFGVFESWLSSMSKKGLYPSKIGTFLSTFSKDFPSDKEYRIEPATIEDNLSYEQLSNCETKGWKQLLRRDKIYIFESQQPLLTRDLYTNYKDGKPYIIKLFLTFLKDWISDLFIIGCGLINLKLQYNLNKIFEYELFSTLDYILFFIMTVFLILYLLLFFFNIIHFIRQLISIKKRGTFIHHCSWKVPLAYKLFLIFMFLSMSIVLAICYMKKGF